MSSASFLTRLASALTERRLQVHGLLLAACVWALYAANLATPGLLDRGGLVKGTDFVHFYILGSLAVQHHGSALYNTMLQAQVARDLIPQAQALYFVALYGPQVSVFFAPFARLSYPVALLLWSLLNSVIYALCCFAIWKVCSRLRGHGLTVFILALAYPAFFHLIAWGQTSAPALLFFTLVYLALRADDQFLAGLAMGLLIYKPQLGIVPGILFLSSKQWKVLAGAMVSAIAELSIGWFYYGTPVMEHYWNALRHIRHVLPYLEPRPYAVHCLRAFWSLLVPLPGLAALLYAVSAMGVILVSIVLWRSRAPLPVRYSVLLLATVLVAPHLTIYDLLILAPAFLFLADTALSQDVSTPLALLLYLCYALPLIGPLARFTHVQLSVLALVGLLYWIWHSARMQYGLQSTV